MSRFLLNICFLSLFISFINFKAVAAAEIIEFAEEDLAKESVLPIFDKKMVVRNRAIRTEGRFEIGGGAGLNLIEALYNNITYNVTSSYHFTETHGFNFDMVFTSSGLSQMGKDLRAGKGFSEVRTFDPGRAPNPEYLIFTNYQMTTYYGKVSVSKQSSFNLSLYGLLGLGMVSWGDATEPAVNVGFGQKFYFNNNFALRADLNLAAYRGPDPTSPKIPGKDMSTGGATYSSDQFDTIFYFRTYLRTAIVYLF